MRNSVIAILLCFLAAAAGASSTQAPAPSAKQAGAAGLIQASSMPDARQELPEDDEAPVMRAGAPQPKGEEKQPRGDETAMVLAAVAVMSGIALRRYGRHMR